MGKKLSKQEVIFLQVIEKVYNDIVSQITRSPANFKLSVPITREVVKRFLAHKDLIENSHAKMKGSDPFKVAGYLTYWIAKLKPIQILEPDPNKDELLLNEYLAISIAISYFYEKENVLILSQKLIDDLKYTLRYRSLTVRIMPIIYEAYISGNKDCKA